LIEKQNVCKKTIVSKFKENEIYIDEKAVNFSGDFVYIELKYSDVDNNTKSNIDKSLKDLCIDVAKVKFTLKFTKPKGNK